MDWRECSTLSCCLSRRSSCDEPLWWVVEWPQGEEAGFELETRQHHVSNISIHVAMQQFVKLSLLYWSDWWLSVEKKHHVVNSETKYKDVSYINWYYEMNGDKKSMFSWINLSVAVRFPPTPSLIAGKLQMELRPSSVGCVSLIKVCHGSESAYTTQGPWHWFV